MAKFLLDTNILSYLEDPSSLFHESVKEKISALDVLVHRELEDPNPK